MHRRLTNFFMLKYLNDNGQNLLDSVSDRQKQLNYLQNKHQQKSNPNLHHPSFNSNAKLDKLRISHRPSFLMEHKTVNETKKKLHNLGYSEKILYISSLVRELEKLVKSYGYFYITEPMLQYDLEEPLSHQLVFVSAHNTMKPIHPIHRKTKTEDQLQFVSELKKTLQEIFPTIDLGTNKTLLGLKTHLSKMQKNLSTRRPKGNFCNKSDQYETKTETSDRENSYEFKFGGNSLKATSGKIPAQPKLKLKRYSVVEQPKIFGNLLTQNNSCIFEEENVSDDENLRVSDCLSDQEGVQLKLAKTAEFDIKDLKENKKIKKSSLKIQDELDNLFLSSTSLQGMKSSQSLADSKVREELELLF